MTAPGRRLALCAQAVKALTGIDYVQVLDPAVQTVLRVFFIVEPTDTVPAIIAAGGVPPIPVNATEGAPVAAVAPLAAAIVAAAGEAPLPIVDLRWRRVLVFDTQRVALEIEVGEPGGFEPYELRLSHPRIDLLSGTILFDFKQACPTGFDCEQDQDCPGDPLVDVPVDYLARDFESIRTALLGFAAARYPDWREPLEADTAVMLMEVMAALGDEFAYQQDRIDSETRFGTATQRSSLAALARLVDYPVDRGSAASGDVRVVAKTGGVLPRDTRLWALRDALTWIPFSTTAETWIHPRWNEFDVHNPDTEQDCLGRGITGLMLKSAAAVPAETPAGITRDEFLIGKRVMILSDPADASRPVRAIPVTITAIDEFTDPLVLTGGNPTFVTRIHWDESEATRFELPYDGLTVAMNIVPVAAGELVTEYFRVGPDSALAARYPGIDPALLARLLALVPAVEREGAIDSARTGRDIVFRFGLRATERQSMRHDPASAAIVEELEPPNPAIVPPDDPALFDTFIVADPGKWHYFADLLDTDLDTPSFTLEPGMWRSVKTHQLQFGTFDFQDYAGDGGWTIRFGSGEFGQAPEDGAIMRARYFTDPGVIANVASFSLQLTPPAGVAIPPAVAALVDGVTNPLPFANARGEESPASIRMRAPEAYRAEPRRAVRPEDYSQIIEKMRFVQRANSTTRWTGSWSTDFVAVDPLASVDLTEAQQEEVEQEIDCIRLAARDARRVDADYLDFDVEIRVCVAADSYVGNVVEALYEEIAAPGFFSPDNFTFGTPLSRTALEARVQAVPGVKFVDSIRIRVHGLGDWRPFSEPELVPGPGEIIRLQNDPDRAAVGILRIAGDGGR
jgi:hypothetical protein